jgi:nucleotide-binding universal stress UspA family protein
MDDGRGLARETITSERETTMKREILVPLDGSRDAESVLPAAVALSRAYKAPLCLFAVIEAADGRDAAQAAVVFQSYAHDMLEKLGLTQDEASVEAVPGNAAEAILRRAAEATMIALATHGKGGVRSAVLGSVADRVVRRSPVPVLAVPALGDHRDIASGPVVVTLDGSPAAQRALPVARALAAALQRPLIALEAFSPIPPLAEVPYYSGDYAADMERDIRAVMRPVLRDDERLEVVCGPAADCIVTCANGLDAAVVVMAASGKGRARRLVLGSTTDAVLHRLHRPLLIVRGRGMDDEPEATAE